VATKTVPLTPAPASAVLCPREVLTLEVLCSKLIQLTVRVLEQRLLDWDLQGQNTRVSWGGRLHRAVLQTSRKTQVPSILQAALKSRGHLHSCGDCSQGSALCAFVIWEQS